MANMTKENESKREKRSGLVQGLRTGIGNEFTGNPIRSTGIIMGIVAAMVAATGAITVEASRLSSDVWYCIIIMSCSAVCVAYGFIAYKCRGPILGVMIFSMMTIGLTIFIGASFAMYQTARFKGDLAQLGSLSQELNTLTDERFQTWRHSFSMIAFGFGWSVCVLMAAYSAGRVYNINARRLRAIEAQLEDKKNDDADTEQ